MQLLKILLTLAGLGGLGACHLQTENREPVSAAAVIDTYVRIAQSGYEDSLLTARALDTAIDNLLTFPGPDTLEAARQAWRSARVPYMQTETFRFGNPVVDDWEGRINSWPLDEGLIDYTAASYGEASDNNLFYTANIIANENLNIGGIQVDASSITPQLLAETLHEIDGVEANVAIGYHAIEFLLWGQDLHGTNPGAGERSYTDYSLSNCSNGNCGRRGDYLKSVSTLLVSDLEEMVENWQPGGVAYSYVKDRGEQAALIAMLTGMGSLAYGELAGERTRLALLLNDPEEEHDCFSDNTHYSHYYDAQGIWNLFYGQYRRIDGELVSGPSLAELVERVNPSVADAMIQSLDETEDAMSALVDQALAGNTFDVLIAGDNETGDAIISRIVDALVAETRSIESIISALELDNISIEGSDSLDNPALVF